MNSIKKTKSILEDVKVNVKFKLAALWASVTLCYLYCDFLTLFQPGTIEQLTTGYMGEPFGQVSQGMLLGFAIMMSIPGVMVYLSLALKPKANRWVNIISGVLFTVIMLAILIGGPWLYYQYMAVIEIALTLLVVWNAWKWPKQEVTSS